MAPFIHKVFYRGKDIHDTQIQSNLSILITKLDNKNWKSAEKQKNKQIK